MENMKSKFKNLMNLFVEQSLEAGCDAEDIANELRGCGFTQYDLESLGHADIADACQ